MSIYDLARPEVRDLKPYTAAPVPDGVVRLNANEAIAYPYPACEIGALNRYPELRPDSLQLALADLYGIEPDYLCPVRGSSEGIDLLVRTFCRAYTDNVVVLPPTFEMYAAYAGMQAAEVRSVPLTEENGYAIDWQAVDAACDEQTRIVFICSPNNPTGSLVPADEIADFARRNQDRFIVAVDEAYIEFCEQESMIPQIPAIENLVIFRTLSKAYALAGTRCGAVLGTPELIRMLSAMMSPYAISAPVAELVLSALSVANIAGAKQQIEATIAERQRLAAVLEASPACETVWPSAANFILTRFANDYPVTESLEDARILVRYFGDRPELLRCARITIGSAAHTDRIAAALQRTERQT